MSYNQILDHFKKFFPPKIEAQLLKTQDIDITTDKA